MSLYTLYITTDSIVLSGTAGILILQLLICVRLFSPLLRYKPVDGNIADEPVSVIICARNEAEMLRKNLPLVLQQSYPSMEIIVVNDNSTDASGLLLDDLQQQHSHLKIVHLTEKKHPGKKHALTEGIRHASHHWIVVTDADCQPASPNWLKALIQQRRPGTELILGYGAYRKKNGLLNKLIRFDTVQIATQYMSLALRGQAYMGVGRNMAYTKSIFETAGGLTSHWNISSGDDDLFVQQVSTAFNTEIAIGPESFTVSYPKENFRAWIRQKARHISTSGKYKGIIQFRLGLIPLINLFFYLGVIFTAIFVHPFPALCFLIVKWGFLSFCYSRILGKFHEKDLILYIPLLDLIYIFVLPVIGAANLFTGSRKWN